MEKGDAIILAQLIGSMNDAVAKLEKFHEKGDAVNLDKAKREILEIQKKIDGMLR